MGKLYTVVAVCHTLFSKVSELEVLKLFLLFGSRGHNLSGTLPRYELQVPYCEFLALIGAHI